MIKKVKTVELFDCQVEYLKDLFNSCEYPWEMLPKIKEYAKGLIEKGIEGFTKYSDNVLIGQNVKIYPNTYIEGPAIIAPCLIAHSF